MLVPESEVFASNLTADALLALVKRAASLGDEFRDVPPDLREYGVYALRFTVNNDNSFVVDMLGFRNAPRAAASIEGRGRIVANPGGATASQIQFEVGADMSTFVGLLIPFAILCWIVLRNVMRPEGFSFDEQVFAASFFMLFWIFGAWFQTNFLTSRAWPGLVKTIRLLAAGTLEFRPDSEAFPATPR